MSAGRSWQRTGRGRCGAVAEVPGQPAPRPPKPQPPEAGRGSGGGSGAGPPCAPPPRTGGAAVPAGRGSRFVPLLQPWPRCGWQWQRCPAAGCPSCSGRAGGGETRRAGTDRGWGPGRGGGGWAGCGGCRR